MINSGNIKPIQDFVDKDKYDMSGLERKYCELLFFRW